MTDQIDTSVAPYYDDYDETDKFLKILFRPGFSVQARELNELQSQYQKQISRFADHVFANGSMVIPGSIVPDFNYKFVKLESNYTDGAAEDVSTTLDSFVGRYLQSSDGTLKAVVRSVAQASGSDPVTAYVDYVNQGGVDRDVTVFTDNDTLDLLDTDGTTKLREIDAVASSATGTGTAVHIKEGVYYVNEAFHLVLDQTLVVGKYTNTPSVSVGFTLTDTVVTPEDNADLLDNAVGTSNDSAPGAHRYKSDLVLTSKTLNTDGTELGSGESGNYVQLVKIISGSVVDIARTATYSEIESAAAKRTYETSGSFIIDPFTLSFEAHRKTDFFPGRYTEAQGGSYDKFVYILDKGQAYVNGFRTEKLASTYLDADRARTADHIKERNNVPTACDLGQYILADVAGGGLDAIPTIQEYPEIEIWDASAQVGTCRIRAVRHVSSATYRFYIFKIDMNATKTFIEDAKSLRYTDATYANFRANLEQVSSKAVIYDPVTAPAIFPIAYGPTKSVTDVSYTTTEAFDADAAGAPADFTIATGASNRTFINSNIIVLNISTGAVVSDANYTVTFGGSNTQATIDGAGITAGNRYRVFIDVQNASITDTTAFELRTKTLQNKVLSSVAAASEITLTVADALAVEVLDAAGNDVSYKYVLDTGQRDGFYDIAKIKLASGETQTGNLDITVLYFAHSDGDYFAANSYSADDYGTIQVYRAANGTRYDLTNCLDFRPTIATDGTFTGAGSVAGNNVSPNTLFTADVEYYLGRYDLIVLNPDGNFQVITGEPDDFPQKPNNTTDGIVLHEVKVPAYTYDVVSIRSKALEYRRYTMRDVADLEQRLENVEYYTALNLLEKNTSDIDILDGSGNSKFKNGFLVDNFSNQSSGDIDDIGYIFSTDLNFGEGHAEVSTKNVMLGSDAGNSSNVTIHSNGIVTLPYTEEAWAAQTQATTDISVNPYAAYFWRGTLTLTPTSDVWFSTIFAPDIIVDGGVIDNVGNRNIGTVWNNWQSIWSGTDFEVTGVEAERVREWKGGSEERSLILHRQEVRQQWHAARDLGIDVTSPGVWSRIPDGIAGIDRGRFRWVQEETTTIARTTTDIQQRTGVRTFVRNSVQRQVVDNRVVSRAAVPWMRARRVTFRAEGLKPETKYWVYFDDVDVSEHSAQTGPDTTRAKGTFLVTNDAGIVEGYFDIPNTPAQRFRTGTRTLKLYNVGDASDDSGDAIAEANYFAEGTIQTNQRTIRSTRVRSLISQNVQENRTDTDVSENRITQRNVLTGWVDPLAQSFLTNQSGGSFLTSIEVAFTAKDDNIPVTLQLRNMENGFPGNEVLPFGEVTLYPASVTADSSGVTWTKFTFPAPVYIQQEVEYCFALVSNSNKYRVRIAKMGEKDLSTGTYISKQPYMGVFFKSQNGTTWSPDQEADMTFRINRAQFTSLSGSLRAIPNVPTYEDGFEADPFEILVSDPFEALNGSQHLKVFHPNHDMYPGNSVTITVPDANTVTFGGIDVQADLDGNTYPVAKVINNDEYYIDLSGQAITATDSGRFGGDSIKLTSNVAYDILQLNATNLTVPKTTLLPKIKTTDHNTIVSRAIDTSFFNTQFNQNIYFDSTRSLIEGQADFQLDVDFTSAQDNLSPVIDLERLSGFFSRNRINDIDNSAENLNFDTWVTYESDTNDTSSSFARYISKTVTLVNPANSLHVFLDVNRRFGGTVEVWYKALGLDDAGTIDDVDWTEMTANTYPSISTIVGEYKEYDWKVESLDEYITFKVKVVLKSDNTASAPSVMNFRAIATTE